MKLSPGQIVRFTYNHPPEGVDADTGPKEKRVLVLNPNYRGKMHGIDLARITAADRKVLKAILDPMNIVAPKAPAPTTQVLPKPDKVAPAKPPTGTVKTLHGKATNMSQMSPEKRAEMMRLYGSPTQKTQAKDMKWAQTTPLVKDILRRMNPLQEIKNPVVFYVKFVRPFLRQKDAYRQYWPQRMANEQVEKNTDVEGKVVNPIGAFASSAAASKARPDKEKKHPFSMSAFAKHPDSPEEKARQARMKAAKAEREKKEKAAARSKAQYAAKKAGLGKVVKPSVTKPPRNK